MLPNVYGWSWTPIHVIFIGIFFVVALTVAATVLLSWWRARRDLQAGRADAIRWGEEFHDLSPEERKCRHEIAQEFLWRQCDRAFDCRKCPTHAKLVAGNEPASLYYDRGHTWVRREADGTLSVGLDDIAASLIGAGAEYRLPPVGSRVTVHSAAVHARKSGHDVRILSPVDGEVVESGGSALFRVRAAEGSLTHLLSGREAELWKLRETERLQTLVAGESVLADGGVLVGDLPKAQPRADWSRIWGAMFLEP